MTIKCFKLTTGEEIISEVEINQNGWKLSEPAMIIIQQQNGGYGVGLAPFMTYAKSVTIRDEFILAEAELSQNLEDEYRRIFGSGIVVASANALG